jgi:flagellar basal body-associated protein FliL
MLRLLLSFLLLVSLAVPAYASEHGSEKKEEKKEEKHGEGGGGFLSPSSTTFYVRMNPMVLPVIGEKGVDEIVSVVLALEVKDQRTVETVNGMLPKLNDAYVRALYGHIDHSVYRSGRFLDMEKIKSRLMQVTNDLLGKDVVQDVLIQGVNQRRY